MKKIFDACIRATLKSYTLNTLVLLESTYSDMDKLGNLLRSILVNLTPETLRSEGISIREMDSILFSISMETAGLRSLTVSITDGGMSGSSILKVIYYAKLQIPENQRKVEIMSTLIRKYETYPKRSVEKVWVH